MKVCAEKFPVPVELGVGHPIECWLHGPSDLIPAGGTDAA
jgi:hypothetical protein